MPQSAGEPRPTGSKPTAELKPINKRRLAVQLGALTVGAIGVSYWAVGFSLERWNILFWWALRVLWLHQWPFQGAILLFRDWSYYTHSPNPDASILYAATAITYAVEYLLIAGGAWSLARAARKWKALRVSLRTVAVISLLFYGALVISGFLAAILGGL